MATRTEQVDIEFRAKLAQLKAELGNLPNQSKKATNAIVADWRRQWKAAENEGTTAIDRVASEANKLGKIGSTIGGPFGEALQLIGDGSEIASDGLGRTAKAALGLGVAAGAIGALGAAVFNVLDNLEDYRDVVEDLQDLDILDEQDVRNLEDGAAAVDGFKRALSATVVTVTAELSPRFRDWFNLLTWGFTLTTSVALSMFEDLRTVGVAAMSMLMDGFSTESVSAFTAALRDANTGMDNLALGVIQANAAVELYDKSVREAAEADDKATDSRVRNTSRRTQATKREGEELGKVIQLEELRAERQARLDGQMSAIREAKAARSAELTQAGIDSLLAELDVEVEGARWRRDMAAEEERRREDTAAARVRDAATWVGVTGAAVDAIAALVSGLYERQASSAEEGSEAQKKILKRQFAAQKALALVQAGIGTAMAVIQALANLPPPASYAMAAVSGAAGAVQIGLIAAAKQPQFHTGGGVGRAGPNAPDEVNIRAQTGEGVVSRRGMEALAQLNRGAGAAAAPTVVNVIGNRVIDAIAWSAVNNRNSAISRAARNARGVAGHRSLAYA